MGSLSSAESHKAEGNKLFSAGEYQQAIVAYTAALQAAPATAKETAIYLFNRAACRLNLGHYWEAIRDSTAALQVDTTYTKARLRRSVAYEGVFDWEHTFQDLDQERHLAPEEALAVKKRLDRQMAFNGQDPPADMVASASLGMGMTAKQFQALMDHFCSAACSLSAWDRLLLRAVLALHMQLCSNLDVLLRAKVRNLCHVKVDAIPTPLLELIDAEAAPLRKYQMCRNARALCCGIGCIVDLTCLEWTDGSAFQPGGRFEERYLLHPEGKPFQPLSMSFVEEHLFQAMGQVGIDAERDTLRTFLWRSRSNIADGMPEFMLDSKVRAESLASASQALVNVLELLQDFRLSFLQDAAIKHRIYGPEWPLYDHATCKSQDFAAYQEKVLKSERKGIMSGKGVGNCAQCGVHSCDRPLKPCSKCKVVFYCGKECQLVHWKEEHRVQCRQLRARQA